MGFKGAKKETLGTVFYWWMCTILLITKWYLIASTHKYFTTSSKTILKCFVEQIINKLLLVIKC